jgi:aspartate aminotransferase
MSSTLSPMNRVQGSPVEQVLPAIAGLLDFLSASAYARKQGDPTIADFVFGNPHEMPLPGFVDAIRRHSEPRDKNWFAYKQSERVATEVVAASLQRRTGIAFAPEDVFMTNGAFAALTVALRAIVEPSDEVLYLSPPWFFYDALIQAAGGRAVRIPLSPPDFDLPVAAIAAAITERTRAVIVNSPQNPTGRIYSREDLTRLAEVLAAASQRIGRPVRILSDEAYRRIVFDGHAFHSPAELYPETFVIYTYAKVLLTPGERIGYIALPPEMSDRERVRKAIFLGQLVTGWAFPNATLQYAIGELEELSIDIGALTRRRDRMAAALRRMGYELRVPEGTFYMLVRAPIEDDRAFSERLAAHDTFVLPGSFVEQPGWFRISLTANDDMVERGLLGFAAAVGLSE